MVNFKIKQYDTKTAMRATLQAQGNPVDLTQVQEVTFLLKNYSNQLLIDKPVYIVDATAGKVWFPFEESETTKTGSFKGEFVVNFKDGRRETFPNDGYIAVEITSSNFALTKVWVGENIWHIMIKVF